MSPGWARSRAGLYRAAHHRPSVTRIDHDHRDLGRVSGQRVEQGLGVAPDEHDGAQPVRAARTSSSNVAPLARPPATHTTVPGAKRPSEAAAECALVALESST